VKEDKTQEIDNKSEDNKEELTKLPEEKKSDPTKYGDWQVNGRAIDF
jgi:hypothetical protein